MKIQPIRIMLYYLVFLAIVGSVSWVWGKPVDILFQVLNYALIFGSMFSVGWVICKVMKKPMPRWEDRVISSLILFLLFDSFQPFWVFPLVGLVTEAVQRLIRVPTGPIFNPAAVGSLIVSFFLLLPSWWGASFAPRIPITSDGVSMAALITFPVAGYIAFKYKKLPLAIVAAVTTSAMYFALFQLFPLFLFLEGTLAFYLLVMAIEPKTSPILRNEQIAFGLGLGLLLPVLLKFYFQEPYVGALVVMNGLFQLYRYLNRKTGGFGFLKKKTVVPVTVPINQPAVSPPTQAAPVQPQP